MSQRCPPPRLHPPDTTLAGCPSHLQGCHCLTLASCSHARLLLHQMGNGDAGLGVPATLLTEAHLERQNKYKNKTLENNEKTILLMIYFNFMQMFSSNTFACASEKQFKIKNQW